MAETDLVEVLNSTFDGVCIMINRRMFLQDACALRILVEELLKPVFDENAIISMGDLEKMLTKIAESSRTAKLWVMCFIRPIFTTNTHITANREEDWTLHLAMEKEMGLLFFAVGHFNYAQLFCTICVTWRLCYKM